MKLTILNLIRESLYRAQKVERSALMEAAVAEECYKIWHEHNPEDGVGGISRCPYKPACRNEEAKEAAEKLEHLEKTYQFALEIFLDETDDS